MFNDSVSEGVLAREDYTMLKLYKLPGAGAHMWQR
jgi:hypothetical protein